MRIAMELMGKVKDIDDPIMFWSAIGLMIDGYAREYKISYEEMHENLENLVTIHETINAELGPMI